MKFSDELKRFEILHLKKWDVGTERENTKIIGLKFALCLNPYLKGFTIGEDSFAGNAFEVTKNLHLQKYYAKFFSFFHDSFSILVWHHHTNSDDVIRQDWLFFI